MSEFKPLTMSDIRLAAGEGKLSAHDVLNAVNGILRASSLTVHAQQKPIGEDYRPSKHVEESESKTYTAGIDALRQYPYQDKQWHIYAIQVHHKDKDEVVKLRDQILSALSVPPQDSRVIFDKDLRGAIARGWCHPENSKKEMDPLLVEAILREVKPLLHSQEATTQDNDLLRCIEMQVISVCSDGNSDSKVLSKDIARAILAKYDVRAKR